MKRAIATAMLVLWAVLGWAQTAAMTAHFINIRQGENVLLEFCIVVDVIVGDEDRITTTSKPPRSRTSRTSSTTRRVASATDSGRRSHHPATATAALS